MEQLLQCPVCTLYLHNGMSLESHLDTHPKDQVIKALCSLSSNRSNYGSRASTPMHSERSYRSRSRTPATDDSSVRWNTPQLSADHERFWRRTPSRTTKTSTVTRSNTPDTRIGDAHFDSSGLDSASVYSTATYQSRNDKSLAHHVATPAPVSEYEQPYPYFQEQKEEKEVKYSRSAEYMNNSHNVYAYNSSSCMKLQNALLPTPTKKNSEVVNGVMATNKKQGDFIKIIPKSSNIALLKANMGPVQYLAPGVMVSTGPTYVQKNSKNLIMTANIQAPTTMVQTKAISNPSVSHDYSHMTASSGTFSPNTTVVTQNSQIIYSEMVHNVVDGKRFIPGMQAMLSGPENVANIAQTNSVFQNVMVVDQFGNTSCMYTNPQQLLPKPSTSVYTHTTPNLPGLDKNIADPNKTLIIEVSPIPKPPPLDGCDASTSSAVPPTPVCCTPEPTRKERHLPVRVDQVEISPGSTKGLKILSNIKVEVPVQHHKNLLNTVVDLTEPNECDYSHAPKTPERILPDLDSENNTADCMLPDTSNDDPNIVSNTFSVIKNVGNPPLYKEPKHIDSRIHETESSDSCPVPDLICNEKPSISPCSELSDNGDNATHHTSISPKPETSQQQNNREISIEIKKEATPRTYKNNPLRLNNIFVKKHKKVLQIKNAKFPTPSTSTTHDAMSPGPSHSSRSPHHFTVTKMQYIHPEKSFQDDLKPGTLETISIDKINSPEQSNFDADTEEQSMDMELEPVAGSSYNETNHYSGIDLTQVKEEVNSSNEFSNHTGVSERDFTELASLRPINVQYNMANDFSEDSNHRELLELEAASKSKQFASMMNDNYFGDNIYADYFTPDRGESFNTVRESGFGKDGPHLWGEPSQKEVSEFVLPNFIHESYKIAESGHFLAGDEAGGGACSREGAVLDICADERMPPRGELSGQESNGDMDAPWTGMYTEVAPAEPYDLIARESWVSDASDIDSNDKQDHLVMDLPKPRLVPCPACGLQLCSARELRRHCAEAHPPPAAARVDPDPGGLAGVKKEEKPDDNVLAGILQDTKAGITTAVLEVFDPLDEAKSKIIIKQEPKRRKRDNVCATCKVDFLSDVAFHQHLKIHPLECLTCGKCFFRRANLALHIKTHLGIKNYKCEVCEKRFITRQKLVEHHNAHTGRAPVKCPLCPQTFRRYSNMVQHRDRHHYHKKAKVRDYMCQCGDVFHSRAKLRWHRETHDGKPKACQYCSDKFVHRSSLTRHVRRAHNPLYMREDLGKKNENVPCPICKQVYLRTNLKSHLRTHSGKRPFTCIICNKGFSTPWNLKLHRWTHMSRSAKPYKCTLCKGAFIRQAEYIAHLNAHKSVRPYTCNYCGCQFIRKYNCQRHVREHEVAKKYVCKVPDCGKSFHRSYYLSEHMKVHSGARPFSCNICGKSSSNKSNHNKHVKIHHAREPVATEA